MLSAVLRTIATHALFQRGDRVLVAVSGGPDSMSLLHALWEARDRLGIALEVAAIDHGLRPEAAAEIALVRARAEALELPFVSVAVDVRRERGRASLQDAARRARLGALAALAAERGAARVALGHNADDQAETVLFRIVRGTGLRGLGGIPYRRDPFVRPLLDVRRVEIERYLARRSIPFVRDPSNADPHYARARIRHQILPLLAGENPRVAQALINLARAARGEPSPPAPIGRQPERAPPAVLRIDCPGTYRWAEGKLGIKEQLIGASIDPDDSDSARGRGPERLAEFDAGRLAWPLVVRPRSPGDRMRPRGGPGSRKLSDLMIDAKIDRHRRPRLPVVTAADGTLLWVPGLRPAEVARPSHETRRLLCFTFFADEAGSPKTIV
ncbi:MAG TPA: tRNA lysidine(34) synthetase TilS [Polyangia bacterium]|nr:tRNA lysidine(34) synthetase TilS [Polyangia bacterium]